MYFHVLLRITSERLRDTCPTYSEVALIIIDAKLKFT